MDDCEVLASRRPEPVAIMLRIPCGYFVIGVSSNEFFRPVLKQSNIQRKTIVEQSKSSTQNRAATLPRLHLKINARSSAQSAGTCVLLNPCAHVQCNCGCGEPVVLYIARELPVLFFNRRGPAEVNAPNQP